MRLAEALVLEAGDGIKPASYRQAYDGLPCTTATRNCAACEIQTHVCVAEPFIWVQTDRGVWPSNRLVRT